MKHPKKEFHLDFFDENVSNPVVKRGPYEYLLINYVVFENKYRYIRKYHYDTFRLWYDD